MSVKFFADAGGANRREVTQSGTPSRRYPRHLFALSSLNQNRPEMCKARKFATNLFCKDIERGSFAKSSQKSSCEPLNWGLTSCILGRVCFGAVTRQIAAITRLANNYGLLASTRVLI
jgi:hypothetical protein